MPFTIDTAQLVFLMTLKNYILNVTDNAELLDEAQTVVKTFTLTSDDISVYASGSTAIIRIHILDTSNDVYNFRYVRVKFATTPGGTEQVGILHELAQTYSKGASQSVEIYIYTGIAGCI